MKGKKTNRLLMCVSCVAMLACSSVNAQELDEETQKLLSMSLEDIVNMQVTSVSKRSEKYREAAAAIYVINKEDIRRSGATQIPELLRMVPGMQVAKVGTSRWAVSARGFNSQFVNKLLVLIDGRSVYTPIFSGVYWDAQDVLLEDVERIEVIRGPGATLWGANAVNGVINIITKNAEDAQGSMVTAGVGKQEKAFVGARTGFQIDEEVYAKTYGKFFVRGGGRNLSGVEQNDDWRRGQGGFRADWKKSKSKYTLQGDVYSGTADVSLVTPTLTAPYSQSIEMDEESFGGNVLFKWDQTLDNDSVTSFQAYYDVAQRNGISAGGNQDIHTLDLDFQHALTPYHGNEITWGIGYRNIHGMFDNTELAAFTPDDRYTHLYSMFLQDKITLIPDELFFTIGSKLEHNSHTGFEVQPSARASYLIDEKQTLWAGVSRAVRTPNLFQDDGELAAVGTPVGFVKQVGRRGSDSEELIAYEAGYRIQPRSDVMFDIAVFYNDYTKLANNVTLLTTPVQVTVGNSGSAQVYGSEVAVNWEVTDYWELAGSYSYINIKPDKTFETIVTTDVRTPKQQLNVRSYLDLPYDLELTNLVYYVDEIVNGTVDSYIRFDTNLTWEASDGVELSLIGQNLFDDYNDEFVANFGEIAYENGRTIFGKVRIDF